MYIPQDILNGDINTRVAGSYDVDNLWIPLEVLQVYRLHVRVYSGGSHFFVWEIITMIGIQVVEFEKILCQCWVYIEWD